ncbi:MAG: response regulator [Ignavibacteriales bacterium]|nr:MAG: response regulator [Ignavibacteriales bacterium]
MLRVLIVDDSNAIRQSLIKLLQNIDGLSAIDEANDLPDAKNLLNQFYYDAIVLDINLPSGPGIELIDMIKSKTPTTVVMMLTNYTASQYVEKCKLKGADYFFDKTTEFDRVVIVLDNLVQKFSQTG